MTEELGLDLTKFQEVESFYLVQYEPTSQTPETGVVAIGVVFPPPIDTVILGWLTDPPAVEIIESLQACLERHEQQGTTEVVFPTGTAPEPKDADRT